MKSRGLRLRLGSPALRSCSPLKLEGDLNPSSQRGNPEMARHTVGLALSRDGGCLCFILWETQDPTVRWFGKGSFFRIQNSQPQPLPFSAQHSRALASDTLRSHQGKVLLAGWLSVACSVYFPLTKTISPEMAPPTVSQALPHQSLTKTGSQRLAYRPKSRVAFSD